MKFVLITPTRNEESVIEKTLNSVINQSLLPIKWMIMDDGSSDKTKEIIHRYDPKYPWIDLHALNNFRPELKGTGARVASLVNYAVQKIDFPVEYIVKIDSDVSFKSNFFESIFKEFDKNTKLGIASGNLIWNGVQEKIIDKRATRGAVKIYKKQCFDEIGGLFLSRGEDVMDGVSARFHGWETETFPVPFIHLKTEGVRASSIQNHLETGLYKGSIPYHFLFFIFTLFKSSKRSPFILGSLVQLYGYVKNRYLLKYHPFPIQISKHYQEEQKQKLLKYLVLLPTLVTPTICSVSEFWVCEL